MKKLAPVLRIVLAVICVATIVFCAYKLYSIYAEYEEGTKLYNDLANEYVSVVTEVVVEKKPADIANTSTDIPDVTVQITEVAAPVEKAPLVVDFEVLKQKNSDVVGWIYCADTPVNYPIVQSSDNSYYLRRMLNKRYNIAGSLFMDYQCSSDFSDGNSVVYGHNLNNDAMFAILPKYKSQEYYEEHPKWYLFTPDANYRIELVGGYDTTAGSDAYTMPADKIQVEALIAKAKEESTFTAEVGEVTEDCRLITLSTCAKDYGKARYVLVGILRLLEDES